MAGLLPDRDLEHQGVGKEFHGPVQDLEPAVSAVKRVGTAYPAEQLRVPRPEQLDPHEVSVDLFHAFKVARLSSYLVQSPPDDGYLRIAGEAAPGYGRLPSVIEASWQASVLSLFLDQCIGR